MSEAGDAVRDIRDNLKDSWRSGVNRGDLQDNNKILGGLTSAQTNDVIENLTEADLNKWTDEIYDDNGIFTSDGLIADERTDLYNNLARDLEPEQLQRVYNALGDEARQNELISSISAHSSDSTKAELVGLLASDTTDKPHDVDSGWFSTTTEYHDQDAKAVSTLISSMTSSRSIEAAINSLDNRQLQAVLKAGTAHTAFTAHSGHATLPSHSFDTQGITQLLITVGRSHDLALKARVFELGSRQIDEIRGTHSLLTPNTTAGVRSGEVADALSALLDTDTTGIITALERGDGVLSSRAGNGISSYMAELVRQDDTTRITNLIAKLQTGNDLSADPVEFLRTFEQTTSGVRDFQNASNLGYVIGGVREGIAAIESNRREQAELVSTIFGTALGLGRIPKITDFTKAALVVAGPLSKELINAVSDDLGSGHATLGDSLEALAIPEGVYSSDVTGPFGDAVDLVIRN
ncbi:MAG: hypothetical protein V3U65_13425 [Granulosicoccaceae bacterium]